MIFRSVRLKICVWFLLTLLSSSHSFAGPVQEGGTDSVELLSGAKMTGTILEIRKDDREFEFRTQVGSQQFTKTYSYDTVHAVTFNGRRFVLTAKQPGGSDSDSTESENPNRSKAEVLRLIRTEGASPPPWWNSTDVDYPPTLDLSWPLNVEGNWNNQKNVGQFIWDIVNPNPRRWRPGIKLVHQIMEAQAGNATLLKRDMESLGRMYFILLQDYPRAAFWLQQADVSPATGNGVHLAECYWRLGNKAMALEALKGRQIHVSAIKLLGDMGEIRDCLRITQVYANSPNNNEAFLAAGDALRSAGQPEMAIRYYQRVLDTTEARNEDYLQRFKARAQGGIEAIELAEKSRPENVPDGAYRAQSTGYNGPLEVEVTVQDHRIEQVQVTKHNEKQFYAAIDDTTSQIVQRQSVQEVDGTSGATITSQAIIHATAKALASHE